MKEKSIKTDEKRLAGLRSEPCSVCGCGRWNMDNGQWENDAHHIGGKGLGGSRCDDANTVTLCRVCHSLLHNYPAHFRKNFGENKYKELKGIE